MSLSYDTQKIEPVFILCGALSTLGSSFVLLTAYNLASDNLFLKILTMVSLSDLLASAAFSFGYVTDPTQCEWQGIVEVFFFRATWLWTLAFSHQLFELAKYGMVSATFGKISFTVWVINIILEIIPLLLPNGFVNMQDNIQYGTDDERYGKIVCSLRSGSSVSATNEAAFAVLFAPLCVVLLCLLYFWIRMYRLRRSLQAEIRHGGGLGMALDLQDPLLALPDSKFQDLTPVPTSEHDSSDSDGQPSLDGVWDRVESNDQNLLARMSHITKVMCQYPSVLFACWTPLLFFFVAAHGFRKEKSEVNSFEDDPWRYMEVFTLALASLHGAMLACIFFANSQAARSHWSRWLHTKCTAMRNLC